MTAKETEPHNGHEGSGEPSSENNRGNAESGRWKYESEHNYGIVTSRLIEGTISDDWDETTGSIETLSVDRHGVPISTTVESEHEERVGTMVHLSPEDAEALAKDLIEQAGAARETIQSN